MLVVNHQNAATSQLSEIKNGPNLNQMDEDSYLNDNIFEEESNKGGLFKNSAKRQNYDIESQISSHKEFVEDISVFKAEK
jgi:hypothetical protein